MRAEIVLDDRFGFPTPERPGGRPIPCGTIIDNPKAYLLVQMGVCVPADDECEQAAGMTKEQMATAIHAQIRATKGIHPEDFEAYDSGEMTGYDGEGNWIVGENYIELDEDDEPLPEV